MGDPGGIGPEISVKAALDKRVRAICQPVLVGARDVLALARRSRQDSRSETEAARVPRGRNPRRSMAWRRSTRPNRDPRRDVGEYAAVVGAPHTETAIHAAGIEFDGYPSFVARTSRAARPKTAS